MVAENKLLGNKMVLEKMISGSVPPNDVMNYGSMKGMPRLQQALCDLLSRTFAKGTTLDPHNLCILSGGTAIVEALFFCICNPNAGVLIPAPYYPAFDNDLQARCHLNPIGFPLDEDDDIWQQLDRALVQAVKSGTQIKSLLITNPNNPLGIIYKEGTVEKMMLWCFRNEIHYVRYF